MAEKSFLCGQMIVSEDAEEQRVMMIFILCLIINEVQVSDIRYGHRLQLF